MMLLTYTYASQISTLITASLTITSTWASPLGIAPKVDLQRRQDAPFAITGIHDDSGTQQRLEIRDLQQNADQWNIYLLGIQRMQAMDQNDMLSWFQIAGIHGAPYVPWNGVNTGPGDPNAGYCTHGSPLFLSWHRPYLALYELMVVSHARDAAAEFPDGDDKNRYVEAAKNLRAPYWDWARTPLGGQSAVPDIFLTTQVTINTPGGQQTIDNPLYSYKFHPIAGDLGSPFAETHRNPRALAEITTNDDDGWKTWLEGSNSQFAQRLFNMFSNYNNYMNVSTSAWIQSGDWTRYDSFESVHDAVHVMVGGGNNGNMGIVQIAAFDPIFWLHHVNIDRITAMWQALYPDSYLQPDVQKWATYWSDAGMNIDADTQLKPFYSDGSGNFHTSNSVRDWTSFGYTYPEVASGDPAAVRASINILYGDGNVPQTKRSTNYNGEVPANATDTNENPRDYVTNIRSSKTSQGESYAIRIFLGDFTADTKGWASDPNLVGTHGVFAKKMSPGAEPAPVSGAIMLRKRLQKDFREGKISGLTEDIVVAYLKKNLHWRVQKMDGCEIPREAMPELKVGVVSTEVQPSSRIDQLAKWVGETKLHTEVTDGRPGGLCEGDDA